MLKMKKQMRGYLVVSIQLKGSSQAGGFKGKKPWKNMEKKSFVRSKAKPNVAVKNTDSKQDCKTCGNLHFGECWFKGKQKNATNVTNLVT